MRVNRASWFTWAAFLALIASLAGGTPPPRPSSFFGMVTAGGNAAPAGTAVSAWIDGVKYAEATVFAADGTSVYRLDVPGDLPGTAAVEGGLPDQTVVFKVGSAQISQSAAWQDGTVARLDITAPLGPDVSVSLDDGVTQAAPDTTLTYTISVINRGPGTATGVIVHDTLSPATAFVSATSGGTAAGGVVTWPAFDLAEGQSATRTVTAKVSSSVPANLETITNVAVAFDDGSQGIDRKPGDNTVADVDALNAAADLAVSVSNGVSQALPGQRLEYRITVANNGNRDASGVVLRNTLPDGITFFAASDSGAESGTTLTWPAFNLAGGATVTRSFTVRVDDPLSPSVTSLSDTAEAGDASGTDLDPVVQKADLVASSVDAAGTITNPQTLAISGSVSVEVGNEGNLDATDDFALAVFEDRDGDGLFTAAADNLLGQANVTDPLAAGESLAVPVVVSGSVLFADNRILAFVDSLNAIAEHDESNNVGHTGQDCGPVTAQTAFTPVLELTWPRPDTDKIKVIDSASSPVVVDLDLNGVPDIVFTSANFDPPLGSIVPSMLRAIRGDTGAKIFDVDSLFEGGSQIDFAQSTVAVGNLDSDAFPEIVTAHVAGSLHNAPFNVISIYEHTGTRKKKSAPYSTHPAGTGTNRDNPVIADIDRDGVPEIVVGAHVFNNDLSLRWKGAGGQAYQSIFNNEGVASGAISLVADLDLTGDPEIVTGNTAYRSNGSIYWQIPLDDGYPAVANFDDDPFPEIVVVAKGKVRLHEHDGTLIWGPVVLPGTQPMAGGAPTVADFDADGEPEIGVAGSNFYTVFETDGSVKWQRPTRDVSSGMTGSTVFDFDGDGRFEVVYRDEEYLRIYDGEDGEVRAQLAVNSSTLNEEPVVADVDGDGNAEILVTSDHGSNESGIPGTPTNAGLRVFGDANDKWVGTRRLWNQHAYSVGNVNDDATIPREPDWSWLSHNTYRAQIAPAQQTFASPDLSVSYARADLAAYPVVKITARVGNGGDAAIKTDLPVAFLNGSTLLGTVKTTKALKPGEYEDVTFTYTATDFTARTIVIAADDNGVGASRESECNEANNRYTYTSDVSILGLTLSMSDGLSTVLVGETITYTLTVFNANNHEATGVALTDTLPAYTTLVSADAGGTLSGSAVTWPPFTLAPGATATRSLTVQVSESTPSTVTEIVNQAAVTDDGSHGPDPTPADNSATDRNRIASLRADAGGPYEVNEGTAVTFTAAGSRDRDGSIVSYLWDLDADGAYDDATGVTVTRTYADEVSFTVAVKVTDNSGETATDTAPVTVRNAAPVAAAGADRKVVRGVVLPLTATFTDAGTGDTQTATIDWGDGTPVQAGVVTKTSTPWKVTGSHAYAADGVYTAAVCVADNDGGLGCDSILVTVGDGWILLGTSNDTARPGCIQITNGNPDRTGAAWYSQKMDLGESFDKTFRVYLGNQDAADGMMFVLHNATTGTSTLGPGGGWLAYQNVKPSIGVEMDTYDNGTGGGFADVSADHIAVNENGTLDHRGGMVKMPNLEDGKEHVLRLIWNGPGKTLDIHWDGAELLLYSKDVVSKIFAGNGEVYWGLTSASGYIGNEQYFCETAPCAPGVTPVISVGDVRLTENAFATVTASFPVTLSCAASQEVRVDAATVEASALAGKDFEAWSETLVFQPGQTSQALAVPVLGDPYAEYTEQFYVDLAQPQGGTLRYNRGVGTILEEAWTVLGTTNTEVRPGCFRFTDGNWNQGGVAWHQRKIDLTKSFDKTFRVYVGNQDNGVDGLAFILQNATTGTSSIGPTGGYLAYGHIKPSIAVEVDTFQNTTDYGDGWKFIDPPPDHLAVDENGSLDHKGHAPVALPNIEDGREHLLRIVWNAASLSLDVYFDDVKRLVYSKNLIDQIFAGQTQVYWGLSGASGDGGAEQYACDTAVCEPDGAAAISIGGADVKEPAFGGTASASFPVTLACAVDREVRVGYTTVAGSAAAGSDYTATTGTLVFAPGETSKALVVPVVGDGVAEPTELFFLDLSPSEGVLVAHGRGLGTIADGPLNTNPGTLQLSSPVYQVGEAGVSATLQVVRQGGAHGQVSVAYSTANGTATAPADYGSASGTITFANGDSAPKTFQVAIANDEDDEPDETVQIQLANLAGGATLGPVSTAVLTIQDDDTASAPAALSAHKRAGLVGGDGTPSPGDELLYTIDVANSGGSSATQVVLTDEIPLHTRLVAGSVTAPPGTVVTEDPVKVEIGEIGAGETVTVSFRATIDDPVPAGVKEVSNQGVVTSAELPSVFTDDPVPGGNSDPTVTMITAVPKLVAEKTDALVDPDGVAAPGDEIEYQVAIFNTGNTSATDVVLEDEIPPHTTLVPGSVETSAGTVESENPVRVAIGEVAGGARVEVTFRVKLESPMATGVREVSNQGTVTSRELPELVTDDTEVEGSPNPTVTSVSAAPVLRVEKTDLLLEDVGLDKAASPGDTVLYKITVTNAGNTAATGVVLTDLIPKNTALVAGTVQTHPGTVESEEPVRVVIGELAAGATVTISFQVRIDDAFPQAATELVNQATVESGELADVKSDDPDTPEAADSTRTPVLITPEISIGNVTVEEDGGQAVLTVTLSRAGNRELPVSWTTGTGTALAGADYTASSGVLIFAPGETSKTLSVPVLDDLLDELDEVFPVKVGEIEGLVTILDDDAPPQVSVAGASATEGDEGTAKAVFVVSLSAPSGLEVTVSYATADGTAKAGTDYEPASGTLTFPAGTTSRTVKVDVIGDLLDEEDESFTLVLANQAGAGNILDDDQALASIGDASVAEGDTGTAMLRLPVTLSTPSDRDVLVGWSASPGTATEGVDYEASSGTVTFAPGETSGFVEVPVRGDIFLEPDETLLVDLLGIWDGQGVGTIRDDEECPGPELLVNAGGERSVSASGIPGWTATEGSWQRRSSNPAPAEGLWYLSSTGTGSPAELRQDVDVSAYGDEQLFRFLGFVRTAAEDPSDVARIVVEYRDASNAVVLDAFDTGEIASPAEWRPVLDERAAPAGTGWIRVRLWGARFSTAGNDAYFDGLSLVSLKTATLTIGDVAVYEPQTGTAQALFRVRLSCPIETGVTAGYATANGTALAGQDYLAASGALALPAGTTEVTVPVTVLSDYTPEPVETFQVLLGNVLPGGVVLLDPVGAGTLVFCGRSPGYWKTHPEVWPVQALVLGGVRYNASGLMSLLSYEGPDASIHLARQLAATELNLLMGSSPSILPVVSQAHAFLVAHPPGSKPSGALKEQANAIKTPLEAFNTSGCVEVPVIPGS
ncbi:MAG TPA: Calx-beta domain-containing protein [Thermoanaerobaculia bacterium]|nr:Calx-beta domain-containing protein [Thermoanaerobaculia bacterium]